MLIPHQNRKLLRDCECLFRRYGSSLQMLTICVAGDLWGPLLLTVTLAMWVHTRLSLALCRGHQLFTLFCSYQIESVVFVQHKRFLRDSAPDSQKNEVFTGVFFIMSCVLLSAGMIWTLVPWSGHRLNLSPHTSSFRAGSCIITFNNQLLGGSL